MMQLTTMYSQQKNRIAFFSRAYKLTCYTFSDQSTISGMSYTMCSGLNSNEKVVSYFFNSHISIVAMGISCQADHCGSSKHAQLIKIDDYSSSLIVYPAPPTTLKVTH